MQIRLMGNEKLVERIKSFTNQKTKIYSNRNSDEVRLFINIDDQILKQSGSFHSKFLQPILVVSRV